MINIVCYLLLCYTLREAELSDIPGNSGNNMRRKRG